MRATRRRVRGAAVFFAVGAFLSEPAMLRGTRAILLPLGICIFYLGTPSFLLIAERSNTINVWAV